MRRALRRIVLAVGVVVVVGLTATLVWTRLGPEPTARATTVAAQAPVRGEGWLGFGSRSAPVGVVLYPGARVDAAGYAPVARHLARSSGAFVAVVDVPLDIALLDIAAADDVRDALPAIDRWVIGGHSLGGVAAARYVAGDGADAAGLLLWASYPAGGDTVSADVATTSVTGTRDEILDLDAWRRARPRLPRTADLIDLEGVTHAQFGDYGPQAGDGTPGVSDARARSMIVEASAGVIAAAGT